MNESHLDRYQGDSDCPECSLNGFPRVCIACGEGLLHTLSVGRKAETEFRVRVACDSCSHYYEGVRSQVAAPEDGRPRTIVVIDDELSITDLLETAITDAGYTVYAANDGRTGLNLVLEYKPDLLVLDLHMPGMSGFQVLEQLKENLATWRTPVIILSAINDQLVRIKALRMGVVEYLEKPFTVPMLTRRIQRIIEKLDAERHPSDRPT